MLTRGPRATARWMAILWPLGIAAQLAALILLFDGSEDVTAVAVVNRLVGGSFVFCGLIVWQRRPDSRTGALMALSGFLFSAEALLSEVDSHVAYTVGQWVPTGGRSRLPRSCWGFRAAGSAR